MSERDLIDGLARLAGPVVPAGDAYGRLMRRHRRSRRTRAAGWTTGVVAVVVAALFGPIGIQGAATPAPGGPSGSAPASPFPIASGAPITPWVQRLLDSPVRGNLSGDQAFLAELGARLQERDIHAVRDGSIRLLFAGDVDDSRVVLAARHDTSHFVGIAVFDKVGASAAELAAAATEQRQDGSMVVVLENGFDPFAVATVSAPGRLRGTWAAVGVAPEGCQVEVADQLAEPVTWRDSGTPGYVLSRSPTEWFRVTCDGVVRYQGPGRGTGAYRSLPAPTEAELDGMLHGARGEVNGTAAAAALRMLYNEHLAEPPILLWMGRLPGAPADAPAQGVAVAPMIGGGWTVFRFRAGLEGSGMTTRDDVLASETVLAVEMTEPTETVRPGGPAAARPAPFLVIAPRSAATVQVLGAQGQVLSSAALTDGIGILHSKVAMRLRALDAAGQVVGTGNAPVTPLIEGDGPIPSLTNWS